MCENTCNKQGETKGLWNNNSSLWLYKPRSHTHRLWLCYEHPEPHTVILWMFWACPICCRCSQGCGCQDETDTPNTDRGKQQKEKKKAFSVKYKNIKESVITMADKMLLPPSSTTVVALQVTIICASGYMLQHLEALQDWRCALGEADHWGRRYGNNTLDCLKVSPGQEK